MEVRHEKLKNLKIFRQLFGRRQNGKRRTPAETADERLKADFPGVCKGFPGLSGGFLGNAVAKANGGWQEAESENERLA